MLSSCKWNVTYINIQTLAWFFFFIIFSYHIPSDDWSSLKVVKSVTKIPNIYVSSDKAILQFLVWFAVCCCLVPLSDPLDCSTQGFPVLHYFPEFAQTHVHWVGGTIQPSYPLLSPSPTAFSLSQHQGLFPVTQFFPSGGQSIGASASVLPMNTQGWFSLWLTGLISLLFKGLSRVFSNTAVQKHQFFNTQFLHSPALTSIHDHWKNHSLD